MTPKFTKSFLNLVHRLKRRGRNDKQALREANRKMNQADHTKEHLEEVIKGQ